ncbi:MAG TPA: hypothetical protein VG271_09940 [Beijerinckiaceae bacterium]|nr:hypothetical protein [Beijerinckiaceae bacterium]
MRNGLSNIFPMLFSILALSANPCAHAASTQSCNAIVDITDADPKGTNVRATPGGAILSALKNPGEGWIAVHLTGQQGDWYAIDRANLIDAGGSMEGRVIFRGTGWLHTSVVGISGVQAGGTIFRDHDAKSAPIEHAGGDETVDLLGCWEEFLKVHVEKGTGWTKQVCTNMNTTCA